LVFQVKTGIRVSQNLLVLIVKHAFEALH
jgi:hypothetical protein